ncbi:MAG: F0F1 ATP synthase subunit B [Thermoanaerobacteraceae bacterium]|nr:F0F1 ATP synthase subunit B [Thermoanaerobacteraceae bacterium]
MVEINATLITQIIHFLLLLVLLRLVAYKPILKVLEERQKYVASNIEQAERQRAEAEKIKTELEAEMRRTREEAQKIIEKATKASEEQAQAIMESAREEAARLKEGALADIEREKEKVLAELKDQVANLAVLVASKVIRDGLTAEAQERLIQNAVSEVKNLPC